MNRDDIIKALEARGVVAEPSEATKNNVHLEVITIGAGAVRPMVYTRDLLEMADARGMTADEVAALIIEKYASETPNFDIKALSSADYIKDHVKIGLQRATSEEIIKRPCALDEAIEAYLYIDVEAGGDVHAIAKLKPGMIDAAGLDLMDAWTRAELNTYANTTIDDISELLAAMGAPVEEVKAPFRMFVLSNRDRTRGAAAILDRETLAKFAAAHNTDKITAIPSSIHEWLLIPGDGPGVDYVSNMVKEVNAEAVDPVDQLADRAYILKF